MITEQEAREIRKSLDAVLRRLDASVRGSNDKSFVRWYVRHRGNLEDLRTLIGGRRSRITGEQIANEYRRVMVIK